MGDLEKLKQMIDEANYPYCEDIYLQSRIDGLEVGESLSKLARDLCLSKAGIEEMKIGDITIPSPRQYFLMLASRYRSNLTGVVTRADEY